MTYVANTPLATDTPGILPAQVSANFGRLQTIIGADHQFNNGALANDGWHNLIHMTEQVPVPAIAGTGQLYVKTASGVTQLFFTDSAGVEHQITPESTVGPIKITGTAIGLASGGIVKIAGLVNPTYDYTAYSTVYINGTLSTNSEALLKTGATASVTIFSTTNSLFSHFYAIDDSFPAGPGNPPTTLYIINLTGAVQNLVWSIMLNRTT